MVQIAGNYKLEKNENFAEYLKALGAPDELVEKANKPGLSLEITADGNKYAMKSSTKIDIAFTLGEEFDEALPMGITLKSKAKLDGNIITITSTAPDGRSGSRTYEFTDKGFTVVMTHKDIVAKRHYVRA